jgi:transcriptional regulator with XRE-family HTH domain
VNKLNARVIERLREEAQHKGVTTREIAEHLNWSQSRVAKLLAGRVEMTLDKLEALCGAIGLRPTEAVRDKGMEFAAEMSPTEFRIVQRMQQEPHFRDLFLLILDGPTAMSTTRRPPALDQKKKPAKAVI